jgi:serine protease Do
MNVKSAFLGSVCGLALGAGLTALAFASPLPADEAPAPEPQRQAVAAAGPGWGVMPNLADLVETVSPSVVQIIVRTPSPSGPAVQGQIPEPFRGTPFEEFFSRPFGQPQQQQPDRMGSGSGFFIDRSHIVTNNHVVDGANKVVIRFSDGKEIDATVVGTDPKTDLAVLKVAAAQTLAPLAWGDSNRVRAGDSVFAVGSPFGLGNTVTAGIISARGRNINSGPYDDFLQVDAPINRGNSGGPLFDASGRVIGVNSAIYSPTGGNVGIGFSIPSDIARGIVSQIIDTGTVQRGWLGVQIQSVTQDMAKGLGFREAKGAIVAEITRGSPAEKAGFAVGDVILKYGDRSIAEVYDLTRAVADTKAGTARDVVVLRNGREVKLNVKIAALEEPAAGASAPAAAARNAVPDTGVTAFAEIGVSLSPEGVVREVAVNGPASDAGIRAGDRIRMVNQSAVSSAADVRAAIDEAKRLRREAVSMQIEREGVRSFIGVPFAD